MGSELICLFSLIPLITLWPMVSAYLTPAKDKNLERIFMSPCMAFE